MSDVNTIAPHKYPLWVTTLGIFVFASLVYSLEDVPKNFVASKVIKTGHKAYNNRQYTEAIKHYEDVLAIVPSSKEAKISLAEVYFTEGKPTDIQKGLSYLQGIDLDKSDMKRLRNVIPKQYQKNF
jgi:Tfp pilus assembly protein PilF